jgi:hypothetical protein
VPSLRTRLSRLESAFRTVSGPAECLPAPAGLRVRSATFGRREHTSSSAPTAAASAVSLPPLQTLRLIERDWYRPMHYVRGRNLTSKR